jgi:BolA family transcriptional regulator, general stress-responsive regulator
MCVAAGGWQWRVGTARRLSDMRRMQSREDRLRAVLTERFAPVSLRVTDDSSKHAGHSGARAEGQTHYSVLLVTDAFRGQSRVDRHRQVNAALADEFAAGLHALALTLRTPEEQAKSG